MLSHPDYRPLDKLSMVSHAPVMSLLSHDPVVRLPCELINSVFGFLPIHDAWRLRSVSRLWHDQLTSEDTIRAVITRWNTHERKDRASYDGFPEPTMEHEFRRIQNFLLGRPAAFALIKECSTIPSTRRHTGNLAGNWLAYRDHQFRIEENIRILDLSTGTARILTTVSSIILDSFALSTHMVAFIQRNLASSTVDNSAGLLLTTINLQNFVTNSIHIMDRSCEQWHPQVASYLEGAADKYCYMLRREHSRRSTIEQVDIVDGLSQESWSFDWQDPISNERSCRATLDADARTVTFWKVDSNLEDIDPDSAEPETLEVYLVIYTYSFSGVLLSIRYKDILLDWIASADFWEEYHNVQAEQLEPYITAIEPEGAPYRWTIAIAFKDDYQLDSTLITVDLSLPEMRLEPLVAYNAEIRRKRPLVSHPSWKIWKDVIFRIRDCFELCVIKRATGGTINDIPAMYDMEMHDPTIFTVQPAIRLMAVNESFLLLRAFDQLTIYAFDELVVDGLRSYQPAIDEDSSDNRLQWKSLDSCFVRGTGLSSVDAVP